MTRKQFFFVFLSGLNCFVNILFPSEVSFTYCHLVIYMADSVLVPETYGSDSLRFHKLTNYAYAYCVESDVVLLKYDDVRVDVKEWDNNKYQYLIPKLDQDPPLHTITIHRSPRQR